MPVEATYVIEEINMKRTKMIMLKAIIILDWMKENKRELDSEKSNETSFLVNAGGENP